MDSVHPGAEKTKATCGGNGASWEQLFRWPGHQQTAAMIISRLDLGHGDSREEREW